MIFFPHGEIESDQRDPKASEESGGGISEANDSSQIQANKPAASSIKTMVIEHSQRTGISGLSGLFTVHIIQVHIDKLAEACEDTEPSGDFCCEVFSGVRKDEEVCEKIEEEAAHGDGVGGNGSRSEFNAEISERTHDVFIYERVTLGLVLVLPDTLFTLRGNVVLEEMLVVDKRRELWHCEREKVFFGLIKDL